MDNMEFSQIDNVDVDVNADVKSHPVGSTTVAYMSEAPVVML